LISGISRIRNESLILEDTLNHYFKYCDHIYIYDDCSTDNSVEIMKSFDNVTVIQGKEWKPNQWQQETTHRKQVFDLAKHSDMVLCFDADERLVGELPTVKGCYSFDLYDGYLIKDSKPYIKGKLEDLPRMWGSECREILFYFDPHKVSYDSDGQRQPTCKEIVKKSGIKVKHFGKCLSVEHWNDTCNFYAKYFPQWSAKWESRKGKAIHTESDFNTKLLTWNEIENINCG
jgi:glycosyltransferase involved in cell wall biosynthesis